MNFTSGAAQNSENVALIASEAVVAAYTATGRIASSPRCPLLGEKIGVAAQMWPDSNRNRRRDETGPE